MDIPTEKDKLHSTGTGTNSVEDATYEVVEEKKPVENSATIPISMTLMRDEHDSCKNIIDDAEMNHTCTYKEANNSDKDSIREEENQNSVKSSSNLKEAEVDLQRSVRQVHLARRLTKRPAREDLVQRGILKSSTSSRLSSQITALEHQMNQDSIKHSLQNRPGIEELVNRNIQVNPQLTPVLRAKASELEMKMKKHMMEQKVFKRPTPYEIRSRLPGVYASLSEDAKQSNIPTSIEDGAMKKVYTSFVEATFEQLLISDKISTEEYNQLYLYMKEDGDKCTELVNAAIAFNESRDMEEYEKTILNTLKK